MNNKDIITKIKAEINKRILREREVKDRYDSNTSSFVEGSIDALDGLLSFLSTLESEKPIQDGLEEEYKDYVESDPVYSKLVNRNAGLGIARHFAQWQKEQMMKEAVKGYVTLTLTGVRTVAATIKEEDNIEPGEKVRIIIVKED